MATIELDIIKQRTDKLMPSEKRELIDYLAASLADQQDGQFDSEEDLDSENPLGENSIKLR